MEGIFVIIVILSRSGAEAKNPYGEALVAIISGILRCGVCPKLAQSFQKIFPPPLLFN
jgi:hypothetical protein